MLRHIAVFRWKAGTTDEQVDAIERGLTALRGRLPMLRAYAFGRDQALRGGNATSPWLPTSTTRTDGARTPRIRSIAG
jgi:hypothetical protein